MIKQSSLLIFNQILSEFDFESYIPLIMNIRLRNNSKKKKLKYILENNQMSYLTEFNLYIDIIGRWTIGRSGERGSGISVLPARYDDDDDISTVYVLSKDSFFNFFFL